MFFGEGQPHKLQAAAGAGQAAGLTVAQKEENLRRSKALDEYVATRLVSLKDDRGKSRHKPESGTPTPQTPPRPPLKKGGPQDPPPETPQDPSMKPLRPPKTAPNGGYLNRDLLGVGLGGGGPGE